MRVSIIVEADHLRLQADPRSYPILRSVLETMKSMSTNNVYAVKYSSEERAKTHPESSVCLSLLDGTKTKILCDYRVSIYTDFIEDAFRLTGYLRALGVSVNA